MKNTTTPAVAPLSANEIDKLEVLARAADQGGGQHIYIHWRDSNNWQANEAWHNAASPEVFLAPIAQARAAQPADELREAVRAIVQLVRDGEWADLLHTDADAVELWSAVDGLLQRAAQPKREMPPEMKAAIKEAHKTGATSALLPNGSAVFINYGHDYGDNDHLCCTACGGSGHIEDQQARAATVASVEDAARLDFLDTNAHRFRMGWEVGAAPVGNLSVRSIIMGGKPIREAIDAAMSATQEGK